MDKILTIIVPSYNMEAYLPKSLGSLIIDDKELLQKLDVIVVNDGSKDRTSEIAHGFEAKYPGVFRVIDKVNGHYGSCINAGLAIAEGMFVKILEADDMYGSGQFQRYLEFVCNECLGEEKSLDLILNDYCTIDADSHLLYTVSYGYPKARVFGFEEFETSLTHHIMNPSVAYRTKILRDIAYRQTEGICYTDLEWLTYPMKEVRRIAYCPETVYQYFIGRSGQSVETDTFRRNILMIVKILVRMFDNYQYLGGGRSDVERYVDKVILAQLRLVYNIYLLDGGELDMSPLLDLDARLAKVSPNLFSQIGEMKANSRKFNFYYVREFRRSHTRSTLKFWLFDLYRRFVKRFA